MTTDLPTLEFIPGPLYLPLFHVLVLGLVAGMFILCWSGHLYPVLKSAGMRAFAWGFGLFTTIYFGLRPVIPNRGYSAFCDSFHYKFRLEKLQNRSEITNLPAHLLQNGEWLYNSLELLCAHVAGPAMLFLICAGLYTGGSILFCRRVFGQLWALPFFCICSAYFFCNYLVNGVRNGVAASLFILALSYRQQPVTALLLLVCAAGFHQSILIPAAAALLALCLPSTRVYLGLWVLSILLVAVAGPAVSHGIAMSGIIPDERFMEYGARGGSEWGYYTGFRADFLLYSSFPILCGIYFTERQGFADPFYRWLLNIYLLTNTFWVLMMYASFSNRFAQLSWFLFPIVCIYPWMKRRFFREQDFYLGGFLIAMYAYTFYENFIRHTH